MQAIAMRKDKIPVPVSTVILAIVAITYKLVLVIIGVVVLAVKPAHVMQHIDSTKELIYLGLGLNIICIAVLLLLVFKSNTVKAIAEKSVSFIGRIRPFKHPERAEHLLEKLTGQYAGAAEFYRSNKHVLLNVFCITFVQRCVLFAITWLTYKSFHLAAENPATIMTLQSLISVASDMLPLPGGMGISENLFVEIFQNIFGEDRVLPAMVISRGISHYTQLLVSGIMTVASVFIIKDRRRAEKESV